MFRSAVHAPMLFATLLACGTPEPTPDGAYEVTDGRYWLVVPDGVALGDGPVLVHLHASGAGERLAKQDDLRRQLGEAGLVGVFPDGGGEPGDDWNVGINKDDIPRDDTVFLADVAIDLQDRFGPLELWLGGGSKGGAMTYEMACLGEPHYAGFVPMTGAIEAPLPGPCTHPPAPIRHLEGTEDDRWPVWWSDDPDSSHMGIMDSLAELTTADAACLAEAAEVDGACEVWSGCADTVSLCWYEGEHALPDDWVRWQADGIRLLSGA